MNGAISGKEEHERLDLSNRDEPLRPLADSALSLSMSNSVVDLTRDDEVPPWLLSLLRRIGIADSAAEFRNRCLNPAFRLTLGMGLIFAVVSLVLTIWWISPYLMSNVSRPADHREAKELSDSGVFASRPGVKNPARPGTGTGDPRGESEDAGAKTVPTPGAAPEIREISAEDPAADPASDAHQNRGASGAVKVTEIPIHGEVIASRAMRLYHTERCPNRPARRRGPEVFDSPVAAEAAGYRPCGLCRQTETGSKSTFLETLNAPSRSGNGDMEADVEEKASRADLSQHLSSATPGMRPEGPIVALRSRGIYHDASCPLRPAPWREPDSYPDIEAARSDGLRPCRRCQGGGSSSGSAASQSQ